MTTASPPPPPVAPMFRQRTLIALIAVGVGSLVVALVLAAFSDDFTDEVTSGPNGYSQSSIGHRALIEILQELDIPVQTSRSHSAAKARRGLLVIAEPPANGQAEDSKRVKALIEGSERVLLVLPRWWGLDDEERPGWIADRSQMSSDVIEDVIEDLDLRVGIGLTVGRDTIEAGEIESDRDWPMPDPGYGQVMRSSQLEAEVWIGDDSDLILGVIQVGDTELWLLADPGIIDNAGLRRPKNVQFAVALIDELRDGGPVVFDETLHGFEKQPSLWKSLFQFPLVLVTMQLIFCTVLLLWAAVGRYGPARVAPPAVASGKDFLIRNTAALLHVGGHDAEALRRYLATTIHGVRQILHAPRELDPAALRTWLERVRGDRGGTISLLELERDVLIVDTDPRRDRRIVELAGRIHRWRTEMTHGPRNNP